MRKTKINSTKPVLKICQNILQFISFKLRVYTRDRNWEFIGVIFLLVHNMFRPLRAILRWNIIILHIYIYYIYIYIVWYNLLTPKTAQYSTFTRWFTDHKEHQAYSSVDSKDSAIQYSTVQYSTVQRFRKSNKNYNCPTRHNNEPRAKHHETWLGKLSTKNRLRQPQHE
jgi:hypothetical protein